MADRKQRKPQSLPRVRTQSSFRSYNKKMLKAKMKRLDRNPTTPRGR